LKPVNDAATLEALAVSELSMEHLAEHGQEPVEAMHNFKAWLDSVTTSEELPVFVAFNAPFDWMFVNYYFHRYLGHNPFGHSALDIKSYYMGLADVSWRETAMKHVAGRYLDDLQLTHNALNDALDQAELFENMMAEEMRNAKLSQDSGK
jgi:DNA polymerase III epsilon subunit-like protein